MGKLQVVKVNLPYISCEKPTYSATDFPTAGRRGNSEDFYPHKNYEAIYVGRKNLDFLLN